MGKYLKSVGKNSLDFLKYVGPGLLVTVGFIDPGNWASNIAAGSGYGYSLLWMVTLSTVMLIILQHNAAHLGIVTGLCISEAASRYMNKTVKNIVLWTAVAAAVAEAVTPDADVYSIIQAGIYGAKEGARIGRKIGRDVAGPSVVKRIEMAVDIGLGKGTQEEKMVEIAERIGMGLHVAEAIPSAFGFFAAGSGNPMDAIIGAVNAGYDTDTVATMAGAMAGALSGSAAFPEHFLPTMEKINGFEIRKTADDVEWIAGIRQKRGEQNVR